MKKLLAIAIMCVLTANVAIAQNNHRRMMMRPHFETLDSATKSNLMKMQKDFWEKQMKKNDKKWKKQSAFGFRPRMGNRMMFHHGFKFEPQEQTAQFIGGEEALNNWIEENITYPMLADVNDIEGKVVVTFDVNSDGSISNVQVKNSINSILGSEVVSKLESMPKWIPAKQNGRPVKMKYTLPISFSALS
jgi:TonB family protein